MRKALSIGLLIIGFLICGPGIALGYTGVVTVDNVVAKAGETVLVDIFLSSSDVPLAGFDLPILFDADVFEVESVSFVGSLFEQNYTLLFSQWTLSGPSPDSDTLRISALPDFNLAQVFPVSATSGLLARVELTVKMTAAPGTYTIDSVNYIRDIGGVLLPTQVNFSDTIGFTLLPDFVGGSVTVQTPTDVDDEPSTLPFSFALEQNYPNPFNPATVITFTLPTSGYTTLTVYNVLGQQVADLVSRQMAAGVHEVTWNASGQPSGVYFYRLGHADGVQTRKMLLVK